MGKIIFSGIGVTDIRGKVGGSVFSNNKGGAFIRNRVMGTYPGTSAQVAHTASVSGLSGQWRSLTSEEQTAWIVAAASGDWPRTDSLGNRYDMTGQQLFVSVNTVAATFSEYYNLPPNVVTIPIRTVDSMTLQLDGSELNLAYVALSDEIGSDKFAYQLWATPGLSPGINRPPESLFRKIGLIVSDSVGNEINFEGLYQDIFNAPALGSKVFLDIYVLSLKSTQKIKIGRSSAIVEAA